MVKIKCFYQNWVYVMSVDDTSTGSDWSTRTQNTTARALWNDRRKEILKRGVTIVVMKGGRGELIADDGVFYAHFLFFSVFFFLFDSVAFATRFIIYTSSKSFSSVVVVYLLKLKLETICCCWLLLLMVLFAFSSGAEI